MDSPVKLRTSILVSDSSILRWLPNLNYFTKVLVGFISWSKNLILAGNYKFMRGE